MLKYCCILLLLFSLRAFAQCPSTLDQQYWMFDSGIADPNHQQSFIPSFGGEVTQINIQANGGVNGTFQLNIYAGTGNAGTLVHNSTHSFNVTGAQPELQFILPCDQTPYLTGGNIYTLEITGGLSIVYDVTGAYPNGYYLNSGGAYTGRDMNFKIWISPLPTPTVSITNPNPITCFGGSDGSLVATVVSGGNAPYNFSWTNSASTQTVSGLNAGIYGVQVMDAANCFTCPVYFTLTDPPQITVDAGPNVTICQGTNHNMVATAVNATSYSWTPTTGLTSSTILNPLASPPTSTTYTLTAMDGNGCTATDNILVNVTPLPTVSAGPDQSTCDGGAITLTGTGTALSYTWNGGVTDGVSFMNVPGTYTYTVTGTGTGGCVATDNVNVIVNSLPTVNAGADASLCDGSSYVLTGSGASTYVWDNGVTDGVAFVPPLGVNTYTVIGTDLNGCQATDAVSLTVLTNPTVVAPADMSICENASIALSGSGASTYTWNSGVSDGVSFVPPLGTHVYVVTGTDGNGCQGQDSTQVIVNPTPAVNAGPDQILCDGMSTVLNGGGADSYIWDSGISNSVSFVPPVGNNMYTVIGTDLNGCQGYDTVYVLVNPLPTISASPDQVFCLGDTVYLSASGASAYSWNPGAVSGANFSLSPTASTTVSVVGTTNGCSDSVMVSLTLDDPSVVDAGSDIVVCQGFGVNLSGSGGDSYLWNGPNVVDENGQVISIIVDTTDYYFVEVTTANGCIYSDSVLVTASTDPSCTIEPFNTITPNGDTSNDFWKILGIEAFPENKVTIYNRWGDIVFEGDSYDNDLVKWEGSALNGIEVPSGTYFYQIEIVNGPVTTGWLQLLK